MNTDREVRRGFNACSLRRGHSEISLAKVGQNAEMSCDVSVPRTAMYAAGTRRPPSPHCNPTRQKHPTQLTNTDIITIIPTAPHRTSTDPVTARTAAHMITPTHDRMTVRGHPCAHRKIANTGIRHRAPRRTARDGRRGARASSVPQAGCDRTGSRARAHSAYRAARRPPPRSPRRNGRTRGREHGHRPPTPRPGTPPRTGASASSASAYRASSSRSSSVTMSW